MGAQHRPQVAPRTEKQQLRRTENQKRRQEATKRGQREPKRPPAQWWSALVGQCGGFKRPPKSIERGVREPQDARRTIFGSKTLMFHNCRDPLVNIEVSEGRWIISEARNRPQEPPRKQINDNLQRRTNQKKRQEATNRCSREPKRSLAQ